MSRNRFDDYLADINTRAQVAFGLAAVAFLLLLIIYLAFVR